MIEPVWVAFGCGLFIGSALGVLLFALFTAGKAGDYESEIRDLRVQRQLLKEEIFRLEKNYKPRKPQPRKKRYKKNYHTGKLYKPKKTN